MAVVIRSLITLFFLFCVAVNVHGKKEKPLSSVADLRYGVALYHYHQTEYLDALTELLIAKERGGIQGHGDNPALMEGGFSLAYGLEKHAAGIFNEILAENVSEKGQVAAWFYLARMRYMRGDWNMSYSSIEELKKIAEREKKSTQGIASDLDALKINLAIKQNDRLAAEKILKQKNIDQDWLPYLYFNLGSAAAREQDFDSAIRYYNKIAEKEYPDNEYRSLYDKAMTAAGYSYLLSGRHDSAMERFSRVRLDSPLSGRALLGYGWAAAEKDNYKEALKVWAHLSKASLVDENSQEALVAVPYAYEKLGLEGLALQRFKDAEQGFSEEIARLDSVINNLKGDTLLDALKIESPDGIDWLSYAEKNQLSPQLSYLIELFSREEFQMHIQQLRDLLGIQKNTWEWREKLGFYSAMLDYREQDRENKDALVAKNTLKNQINALKTERDRLALKIEEIAGAKDYFALASGDEADLIRRASRAKKLVQIPALREDDPFIEDSDEAVRWYYGLLLWDAAENFSDRLWRAVKTLNALDDTLAEMQGNYESIESILNSAPDLQITREQIEFAQIELESQSADVDIAVMQAKEALRQQVVAVLAQQRARIQHYMAQSRLSVARLYDKALKEHEAAALQQEVEAEKADAPASNEEPQP
ncbi:hypothetical protein SAMN02745866_00742 [Alteromonadaceae bacterium Bs31]|nr:hypothetical protein SAMN02745866_00742 [Alteromonadaceae bacterium Bs31]